MVAGVQLATTLVRAVPANSLTSADLGETHAGPWSLLQHVVFCMVRLPRQQDRFAAHLLLKLLVARFDAAGQMELLVNAVNQSPFPSVTALCINMLKDCVNAVWPAIDQHAKQTLPSSPSLQQQAQHSAIVAAVGEVMSSVLVNLHATGSVADH